ncbi:hypothetical protein BN7_4785 [Wickerhamomyces ciferrii]|uniref:Uncharacterized protein n=1 Tax=Wickerhamomyces ciferrii (strain ATCC 14091 / BCRC 22168 / CBS 111 / JCM 3599 / NBRC 0793 / NRRL Y-1031 F-60-10) TaxID=1206466 RepID=K0KUU5_WICCF|nr:uncharacterized protein BN7_4785 [Wickerhamomyces ciferrii]CCH45204.1 hypothetical protein BN7_4785 [Wickerhamomyces ciferrii]
MSLSLDSYIPELVRDKISPKGYETLAKVKKFVEEECIPADEVYFKQLSNDPTKRWTEVPPIIEDLKAKARKLGLWNMFLAGYKDGPGFTNLEYGLMAQFLGRSHVAPEATNTNAPDTGNMELFAKYANEEQRAKWLVPLLNGEIRSAFLMTEKGISSSNALNISLKAEKTSQGREIVLNGTKWFASGAGDPRTSVWLVMAKTTPESENPYKRHSVIVIDAKKALKTGNAKIIRPLHVFGFDDAPHGHCEVQFNNLKVPFDLLDKEGEGFTLIQSRLGPASNREIFGKLFITKELFINDVAERRIELERIKLLVLEAALKIDLVGSKKAKKEISIAKIDAPRTVGKIIDWAIQVYGAEGVSQDTPLTKLFMSARMLRIADGPDEAHLNQLGKAEAKKSKDINELYSKIYAKTKRLSKI